MISLITHVGIAARLIKRHEGLWLKVYDDGNGRPIQAGSLVLGHPTIGYGRNLAARGISTAEAEMMLSHDLVTAENGARAFADGAWAGLGDARKAALVDMCHQLGTAGLLAFRQMRLAVQSGDWDMAAAEALDSKVARDPRTARRWQELAAMLRTDVEVGNARAV